MDPWGTHIIGCFYSVRAYGALGGPPWNLLPSSLLSGTVTPVCDKQQHGFQPSHLHQIFIWNVGTQVQEHLPPFLIKFVGSPSANTHYQCVWNCVSWLVWCEGRRQWAPEVWGRKCFWWQNSSSTNTTVSCSVSSLKWHLSPGYCFHI